MPLLPQKSPLSDTLSSPSDLPRGQSGCSGEQEGGGAHSLPGVFVVEDYLLRCVYFSGAAHGAGREPHYFWGNTGPDELRSAWHHLRRAGGPAPSAATSAPCLTVGSAHLG